MSTRTRYEKAVVVAALTAVAQEWRICGERARSADRYRARARRSSKPVADAYYSGECNGWSGAEARLSALYDTLDKLFGHPVMNANDR